MQSRCMRIAWLLCTLLVAALGGMLAVFWAADTFFFGEFERESVPAGQWAIGLLSAASLSGLFLHAVFRQIRKE